MQLSPTQIELEWKYMLTLFLGSYFLSWIFFGVLCYMVAYSHGDFLFDAVTGQRLGEGTDPCIYGTPNLVAMLIYSVETQTTLGFGEKYASEECPETIFLFVMQMMCAAAIEGTMVSIIYAKTARPAKQLTKLKFSDKAVVSPAAHNMPRLSIHIDKYFCRFVIAMASCACSSVSAIRASNSPLSPRYAST